MAGKEELNVEALGNVAGGRKTNTHNERSVLMTNQNGDNNIKIVQHNDIKGNSGNVKVGSPVTVEKNNGPINLTIN